MGGHYGRTKSCSVKHQLIGQTAGPQKYLCNSLWLMKKNASTPDIKCKQLSFHDMISMIYHESLGQCLIF